MVNNLSVKNDLIPSICQTYDFLRTQISNSWRHKFQVKCAEKNLIDLKVTEQPHSFVGLLTRTLKHV